VALVQFPVRLPVQRLRPPLAPPQVPVLALLPTEADQVADAE